MIIQSLAQYYDALAKRGELSPPCWAQGKVSYALRLDRQGNLAGIMSLKKIPEGAKKEVPDIQMVPEPFKKTSGIRPNFLFDSSAYFLGIDGKKANSRAVQCFAEARKFHHEILDAVDAPSAKEVLSFFDTWDVSKAETNTVLTPFLEDIKQGAGLVFELSSGLYAHEEPAIRKAWESYKNSDAEGDALGICMVTGEKTKIARLHPSIKGIAGAQSSGASLVSFNAPAFESYGHENRSDKENSGQGFNSPIGELTAFKYTTVLNHMISERKYTQRIADTTLFYWAEDAEPLYQDILGCGLWGENDSTISLKDLASVVEKLRNAGEMDFQGVRLKSSNRFYVLGIAPNAARLSVRFFLQDSFGEMLEHLEKYRKDLEITRPAYAQDAPFSLWHLLNETANQKSKTKTPPPPMTGAVLRSILMGYEFPVSLYQNVLLRIRVEQDINWKKAAILKAYLLRTRYNQKIQEVLTVELNERSECVPYVLGRLFAVLERLQEDANPGIKATIRDRYFASASTTPASVFPLVLRLSQHHVRKLKSDGSRRKYYDKMIGELMDRIHSQIPARMSLQEQGVFYLGYYHQRQDFFKSKKEEEK